MGSFLILFLPVVKLPSRFEPNQTIRPPQKQNKKKEKIDACQHYFMGQMSSERTDRFDGIQICSYFLE